MKIYTFDRKRTYHANDVRITMQLIYLKWRIHGYVECLRLLFKSMGTEGEEDNL